MLENATALKFALFIIKLDDFNFILSVFDKRAQRQSEVFFGFITKIYRVKVPLGLISVYLLLFGVLALSSTLAPRARIMSLCCHAISL